MYYSEAENITGGTAIDLIYGSNHQGARALSKVKFKTIEAGKYKIYSRFAVGNGNPGDTYATNPFTVGETALVYNVPAKTNTDYTSDEFIVAESTDLYVTFSGSSKSGVDYICVQRTGDATISTTIGTTGYSSFASAYALNLSSLPEGLTAYYASAVGENSVTLTQATGNVAAGTGLILKGTGDATVSIPVVASGDAIDSNLMIGCPTATSVSSNAWVLVNTDTSVEFQYLTSSVEIPAGKAYLSYATPAQGAKLRVIFPGDASGIEEIATEGAKDGVLYNVAGQVVTADYKGIVIKNGKKYLNQ